MAQPKLSLRPFMKYIKANVKPGADFMKGLRLSSVSGWATGSNLSLLAQPSLFLKWFSQKGSQLRPSLSNNHSGFLCHMTIFCSQNILLMAYMFLVWHIISLLKYHFAMGSLVKHVKTSKDYFGGLLYILVPNFQPFQILKWRKNYGGHIWAFVYKT